MKKYIIEFQNMEDIERFLKMMEDFEFNADLQYGSIIVDAKSTIGVLALGIHKKLQLIIYGASNAQIDKRISAFAA